MQNLGATHTEYLYTFFQRPLKLYLFNTCLAHTLPLCSMIRASPNAWLLFSTQAFPPGPCPAKNTTFSLLLCTTGTPCKTYRTNVTHSMGLFPIPHITRRQMCLHKWGCLLRIRLTNVVAHTRWIFPFRNRSRHWFCMRSTATFLGYLE